MGLPNKKEPSLTKNVWLEEAKRLRSDADASEADFLQYVSDGEQYKWLWEGHPTFQSFIRAEAIVDGFRISNFRTMVAKYGFDEVRRYGVHQTRKLMSVSEDTPSRSNPHISAQAAVISDMEDFIKTNGVNPSVRQVESLCKKHSDKTPKTNWKDERIKELEAEVELLRLKNTKLEAENKELRERLSGGKKTSSARK